jgi:hypothetical protein
MSIPELCDRIQDAWISQVISTTTWGYPIVGALHVLAMAVCGGTVLYTDLSALGIVFRGPDAGAAARDVRGLKAAGLVMVLGTGALLFASGAVYYYGSVGFRVKMALLALILLNAIADSRSRYARLHAGISLALWAGVVFASRAIAFF